MDICNCCIDECELSMEACGPRPFAKILLAIWASDIDGQTRIVSATLIAWERLRVQSRLPRPDADTQNLLRQRALAATRARGCPVMPSVGANRLVYRRAQWKLFDTRRPMVLG